MNRSTTLLLSLFAIVVAACGGPDRNRDANSVDAAIDVPRDTRPACTATQALCGEVCIDTQTDRDHCGMCGNACGAGESCNQGTCSLECPAPQVACGSICVSTDTDSANCGACGRRCAIGQVCSMGACSVSCQGGLTTCVQSSPTDGGVTDGGVTDGGVTDGGMTDGGVTDGGVTDGGVTDGGVTDAGVVRYCAQIGSDRNNCGACGNVCAANETCTNGVCGQACPTGQELCGAQCFDLQINAVHCGSCATACAADQSCTAGVCGQSCPANWMFCTDRCVNSQNDRANCGGCGIACPADQACNAGACALTCATGRTNCSGVCLELQRDRGNCGACGNMCGPGLVCSMGVCGATCASGTTLCNGNCADTTSDVANCGACGNVCAAGLFCRGGTCRPACLPSQTTCGSSCVDLQTDPNNCGFCGGACPAGAACSGGACTPLGACPSPSTQCGPVCADLRSDNTHCGTCAIACPINQTCASGTCVPTCNANQLRCGVTCTDARFDRNNCGACGNACAANLSCSFGVCSPNATFQVNTMSIAGCVASPPEDNFNTGAGDDCGGLAVGTTNVLYSGDTATVILPASNVASVTRVPLPRSIGLVSDLRSGEMYTLLDAAGVQQPTSSFPTGTITITQLGLLDGATGALTATRIALSQPLVLNASSNVGIYSGFGRVIFFTATTTADRGYYNVDLPSGLVVPIVTGTSVAAPPSAAICETFAHWGTAEFFGGEYHVLYVRTSTPVGVARLTPRTGVVDTALVADFAGSRGDICMAVFSPMNNRWYFHAEGIPTWLPSGTVAEVVGYCPGTWSAP